MSYKYTFPKKKFDKKDVEFMYVFFDNGDYFSLNGSEVVDLKISLYDRLIWNELGVCPMAESGFLKLKIDKINEEICGDVFLYNAEEFDKDRAVYIKNRCVNEGGIKCVRLCDEDNWHDTIYGNIVGELDGEFLILKFLSQPNFGSSNDENHEVWLNSVDKSIVGRINLDFENCEDFTIYEEEISDIQLEFEDELVWGSGDLFRNLKSGFIKFKFDKEIDYREIHLLDDRKITINKLERRLCGKNGQAEHNICHLYIDYKYCGFGSRHTECVEIMDIRPDEELERMEKLEEEGKIVDIDHIGGYCKKLKDDSLILTFGKDAKNLLEKLCQN